MLHTTGNSHAGGDKNGCVRGENERIPKSLPFEFHELSHSFYITICKSEEIMQFGMYNVQREMQNKYTFLSRLCEKALCLEK